jgi:FOG: TPR repeat
MKPSGNDTKYDASPSRKVEPSKMSKISHLRLKMMKKPPSETKVKTANAVRNYFVPMMVVVASSMLLWAWMYLFQSRLFAAQALTALEHGQSEAALEMFRKSISCNPHNAPAHFYCGLICERNGKLATALDYFNQSARLAPENPDVLDRQASVAIKLERYQLAVGVYKKLFAIKSFVPAAQQIRDQAYALEHLGKYNEALVGYVVSLKLDANNPNATEGVARCQMAQGQYDKAVENLNKLIRANKNDVSALLLRGWSYKNLGFNGMAHSDLDQAIKATPRSAEAHLYKARFMDSCGDRNQAIKEFGIAVAVEPNNKKPGKNEHSICSH